MGKSPESKAARKKLQVIRIETPLNYYTGIDVPAGTLKTKEDLELLVISAMNKLSDWANSQREQGLADFNGYTLHFGITEKKTIFVFLAAIYNRADGPLSNVTGDLNLIVNDLWNLLHPAAV